MRTRNRSPKPRQGGDPPEPPILLSVPEAAHLLGVGTTFCWELVRSGTLPSIRLGRRVLIARSALEQLISAQEHDQGTNTL
jgi:excisionase family DNA binding protein